MKVEFLEEFSRDLDKLRNPLIKKSLANSILRCEEAKSISEIPQVKKLKGFRNAYRIRIREYRAGFYLEDGVIEFTRFLHRKDIYKSFP